ncbi:THAP domain-containing protein 4 [Umbelopsis nana]
MTDHSHPLSFLFGTWKGTGKGVYPTIVPFEYEEEISFTPSPKGFLTYSQRSWTLDEVKKPLHVETGYVRVPNPKKVELVIAQPTGVVSVEEGTINGTTLEVETASVAHTSSAKAPHVNKFRRRFEINSEQGTLHSVMGMATEVTEYTQHLESTLKRID